MQEWEINELLFIQNFSYDKIFTFCEYKLEQDFIFKSRNS